MGRFVMLEQAVWRDRDFTGLSVDARLLFLWAWSNPGAAISGLYTVTIEGLSSAWLEPPKLTTSDRLNAALAELAGKPLVRYERTPNDKRVQVLWVVNRARYANRSPAVAKAMRAEYERVPPCPIKTAFARKYRGLLASE